MKPKAFHLVLISLPMEFHPLLLHTNVTACAGITSMTSNMVLVFDGVGFVYISEMSIYFLFA